MKKQRKTRLEIFKEDIEESKQYHSIEKVAKQSSSFLNKKKELLKNLDKKYFKEDIESPTKNIKPLEKSKLLDYHLSIKLKEIEKTLTQNKFDIPPRSPFITKLDLRDDIKKIFNQINEKQKKFTSNVDYHQINFNKKLSELKKISEEIEIKKIEDFDLEILQEKKSQQEVFEKTQGHKFAITQLLSTKNNIMNESEEKNKQKIYYGILIFGLILIWFIRR